jgi:hypothetical protein
MSYEFTQISKSRKKEIGVIAMHPASLTIAVASHMGGLIHSGSSHYSGCRESIIRYQLVVVVVASSLDVLLRQLHCSGLLLPRQSRSFTVTSLSLLLFR